MIGIDTNVLVALAAKTHPCHANAVKVCQHELDAGDHIALSASIAAEFLHVITDPRRFEPPLEMAGGVRWLGEWQAEVAPVWLASNELAVKTWLDWMTRFQLGRKRILDTQYAALLHTHGIKRILTNNPDDFRIFKVFEIVTF